MKLTTIKNLLEASKDDENTLKNIILSLGLNKLDQPIPKQNNKTLLIWSACYGYEKIVAGLIDANCNLNIQDCGGNTALILAAYHGNEKIVAMLIAANCDINKRNKSGDTALSYAIFYSYENIVTRLICSCNISGYIHKPKTMKKNKPILIEHQPISEEQHRNLINCFD